MSTAQPKREAVITKLTTPELAAEAIATTTVRWEKHGLLQQECEHLWCQEKVDQRGNRDDAKGRSGRPMINVKDDPVENEKKNKERQARTGTSRNSKNTTSTATNHKVTYTKFLGTHVVLYASKRTVPYDGFHASHLCHNDRCIRASHIRVESATLNQQRKGCAGVLMCTKCNNKWQVCKHHSLFKCLTVTKFVCCDPNDGKITAVLPIVDEI